MTFTIGRGTNISHWLSQSKQRGEARRAYFTQADVQQLATMGLDHLRIPIDEEQMWDEAGHKDAEAFALLDAALDWCADAGLRAIVDLHILRTHYFLDESDPPLFADPTEAARFAWLWRQLSEHLGHRPTDMVAYELLNEAVARDPEDWNRVALAGYNAVRATEPARTIVLGSNWFNQHHTFLKLAVPPDDPNMILTFHYYFPMFITHYTAPWWAIGGTYNGPVHYPGQPIADKDLASLSAELLARMDEWNQPFDRSTIVADLAQPFAVRERTGLPLYCGEFGCFDRTPDPLRIAWFEDILSVFAEYDIAWANWDYKGSFGIVDHAGNPTAIAPVLFPSTDNMS
jgi:endoglucanase